MRRLLAAFIISLPVMAFAQQPITQDGEFGFGLGLAHYFGDLNTNASLKAPKLAANIFFRKNFGNYIALRVEGTFAQLGYSDAYNTYNQQMLERNLSFNTKIWELGLQGDFNFFRFMPGDPDARFTPYITIGASIFNYDPYAYLKGEKYYLRPLGTEGQGDSLYPDRKPYSTTALAIPFGVGFKYAFNEKFNVGFEVVYRFTNTDYLDDVSKTYVDPAVFPPNPDGSTNVGLLLSDRSYELGTPIGVKGRQRGNSQNNDQFVTAMFYVSFNIQSYHCPTAK